MLTRQETIPALLEATVAAHGGAAALVSSGGRRWSWSELRTATVGLAGRLRSLGVQRGVRVGLVGDNGPEWPLGYLAIVYAGGTAVPLDAGEPPAAIAARLEAAGAAGALVGRRVARPGESEPPSPPRIPGGRFRLELGARDLDATGLGPGPVAGPAEIGPDDVASLLFTSGTLADPRAVPLTHRALLAECEALSRLTPLGVRDRTLALVPLSHVLGFNTGLMLPLRHAVRVGFLADWTREGLLAALARERPTALCAVPAVWSALRQGIVRELARRPLPARAAVRLLRAVARPFGPTVRRRLLRPLHRPFGGELRTLVTSGAPIDEDEVGFWRSLGFIVLHAYGLTETAGAVSCTRPSDRRPAGVGRPLASVEVRIGDGPVGEPGEILVRGPIVMSGYRGRVAEGNHGGSTRLADGWLCTGDLGRIDERGNLHVLGRAREVIVRRGGETLYPEPIERHLAGADYVAEVAVVPSGPPGDERPLAAVVPDAAAMERDGILDVFGTVRYAVLSRAASLPPAQRPDGYRILPGGLPRTPTRKVRRTEVRRLLETDTGPDPRFSAAARSAGGPVSLGNDPAAAAVTRALREVVRAGNRVAGPRDALGPDLGLDSMDRIALVCRIEDELGRALPEAALQAVDVAALVETARQATDGDSLPALTRLRQPDARAERILASAERTARRLRPLRDGLLFGVRTACRAAYDIRVEGLERIPGSGPFVLCGNHQSYLDPYFLIPALPRAVRDRLWIVAVDWLFRGRLSTTYLHAARTLPMDNRGRFLPGLRMAVTLLRRGESVLLFPEGMRSFDGRVGPWRPGAGLVALAADAPLLPVAMAGVYQILPPGRWLPGLRQPAGGRLQVRIAVGTPRSPEVPAAGEDPAAAAQRTVDRLREDVLQLMRSFPKAVRPAAEPAGGRLQQEASA